MAHVSRGLSLGVGALLVLILSWMTADLVPEASAADPGSVLRIAQKPRAKKKVRGKRPKAEMPEEGTDAAEKNDSPPAGKSDGTIKFSRDIAPILVSNCGGCHNPKATGKAKKLDLSTFDSLMKGTADHPVIVAGKPEESHLVLRVKGEETPRMPQTANKTLSEASIAKIEQWVKAGAVLDAGIDPKAAMEKYAASPDELRKAELARLTPEQRDKQVETAARERWKKANPKTTPQISSSAHFLLFSTLPKDRANAAVKAAEGQYSAVKNLFGAHAMDWGEKASLFVFNDAASYGEFVRAIENREIEAGDVASARFNVGEPYVAVVDPHGGRDEPAGGGASRKSGRSKKGGASADDDDGSADRTLPGLLIEQIVIGTSSRSGKPPRWLTLGLGALVASKVEGSRTPYYRKVRRNAYQLWELGWASKAQEALGDTAKVEDVRAVGLAILEWLRAEDRATLAPFVAGMMAGGEKLDEVIGQVLNGNRKEFLEHTRDYVGANYR